VKHEGKLIITYWIKQSTHCNQMYISRCVHLYIYISHRNSLGSNAGSKSRHFNTYINSW